MNRIVRHLAIGAIAGVTATSAAFSPLLTSTALAKVQAAAPAKDKDAHPLLQLSKDGNQVIRDVRSARIAIFNGRTDLAAKLVAAAQKSLVKAKTDDKAIKANGKGDPNLIAIDGQLILADDFVTTPEKAKHIASANKKLKAGKSKDAIAELKLAQIDVGFTHVLMPIKQTGDHLNASAKLLKDSKFYQANLALKAAEDGLNVETVMLVNTPKKNAASAAKTNGNMPVPAKSAPAKAGAK